MNHNIVHRTALETAKVKAVGLERLPFAQGLFRAKSSSATLESADLESPIAFDDVVGSFSADIPPGGEVELFVKVRTEPGWSDWYSLGAQSAEGFASSKPSEDAVA